MNILYFMLEDFESLIKYRGINTDLLREFKKHGHHVYVVSPSERKTGNPTRLLEEDGAVILKPRIGNIQKTNIIEKGISTVTVGGILIRAIKKYLSGVKFDLVMYCTPPITFLSAIEYIKNRDHAKTYLLLKDIFPQNAVDIGMMVTEGPKSVLYRHFRNQEKKLYAISDRIGCMSQANVDYLIQHNPEIDPGIVEICPNCMEPFDKSVDADTRRGIREKYGIPLDKKVFVYGGNLGRPQGIPFLIDCLRTCRDLQDAYFLIVGSGTEYPVLEEYANSSGQENLKLMKRLPKEDYDTMVGACDAGLIFLDHRFTIPNFPSRILSYMAAKLPVIACTDPNTDVGKAVLEGGFGWWCESDDAGKFREIAEACLQDKALAEKGDAGYRYMTEHYSAAGAYQTIEDGCT